MTIVTTTSNPTTHQADSRLETIQNQFNNANPVIATSEYAFKETDLVVINEEGVKAAAHYIEGRMEAESYTPRTWRTHPLHICPPEPYSPSHPKTRECLDWIFLISSLNFSFLSERDGQEGRYGVEWREGWNTTDKQNVVHTGYWSLVAAIDRALDEGVPFTDPSFYSSEIKCPDSLVGHIFRAATQCKEGIPLLKERIAILRENGSILCKRFGGSFQTLYEAFQRRYNGHGTALQLVKMVTETFPSFRDEITYKGRKVYLWKRAQILVAETWAAFFPPHPSHAHPLFPGPNGPAIHELTMFADYRVPQILHHLRMLTYPPQLLKLLHSHATLAPGCREEVSIRAASIIAVEKVRKEIEDIRAKKGKAEELQVSSVLIDFYLWDLAKDVEMGKSRIGDVATAEIVPPHRTRSIWY
ncbi:hypothetical protein BDY19DRAFT_321683 [Irpex rosettiformis]|uniref:Uncharacterized protein n=1 Tax=Irpex rosettiformis TaxID=378272 RepID=A0ACB8TYB9_9APHY|nr:hypothetical protein BDY19DRAFT_321683 [Irpex rosettiformis]